MAIRKNLYISILLLLIIIGYFYFRNREARLSPAINDVSITTSSTEIVFPAGFKEYKNNIYKFSFYYREQYRLVEYAEGGGAATITLENKEENRGLQIFILPYAETEVTQERLNTDIPSGIVKEQNPRMVADAPGVSFYSQDAFLGETFEVWFIQNGYLYEVTAPKSSEEWVEEILKTWRFIK
jgi:hypothetical protein